VIGAVRRTLSGTALAAVLGMLAIAIAIAVGAPAWAAGTALQAHGHGHADEPEAGLPTAPGGLVRRLEDVSRRSGPGRIAWSTFWTLCWQPVPGAVRYEIRLMTSEGASRTPSRIDRRCHRVEVAAGENETNAGFFRRDLMLAMQAAQSAVQLRAVLADGRTTAWTAEQPVGIVPAGGR